MENQKLLSHFRNILRKDGLKYTPQRVAVLEEIINDKGHRECEEIYLALKQNGSNVSRATVYRTMAILVKNGFARKVELGDGRARYESKLDSPHHDHMICVETGDIIEFFNEDLEELQEKIANEHGYTIVRHVHQLFVKPLNK